MQVIAEFLTVAAVWIAAVILSHLGVQVDLSSQARPGAERVIERTRFQSLATDCPEAKISAVPADRQAV